jgi:hypothetical protein
MSHHNGNARRRQRREEKRRQKKSRRHVRQIRNARQSANQNINSRPFSPSARGINGHQPEASTQTTGFRFAQTCKCLHWSIITLYVGLGCLYLLTEVSHTTVGCLYCVIGTVHAIIRVVERAI